MEIRIAAGDALHSISVTMRTPGDDLDLAAGFLFGEAIVPDRAAIELVTHCSNCEGPDAGNIVIVYLAPGVPFDPARFSRYVYTSSSCGICGKASLEQVRAVCPRPITGAPRPTASLLRSLPDALRAQQRNFALTGGLHAAAFFDRSGNLLEQREDVGRHNAMDKLVGHWLMSERLPASDVVALVSGRLGFELVQKALMAGVPTLAAIGAPSSLAIDLAAEFGMTLIGFLRDGLFNVYAGEVDPG